MKKVLWLIVCLMAMVVSANAQRRYYPRHYYERSYYPRHYYPRHYYQRSYYPRHYYPQHYGTIYTTSDDISTINEADKKDYDKILFGFGTGVDWIDNGENRKASVLTLELIGCNIYGEMQLANLKENTEFSNNEISFSWKVGYIISLIKYKGGFVGVGPVVGRSYIQDYSDVNGSSKDYYWYLHDHITYEEPKAKNWEYGGIAAVRYGYGYMTFKLTNKTIGTSIGLCF